MPVHTQASGAVADSLSDCSDHHPLKQKSGSVANSFADHSVQKLCKKLSKKIIIESSSDHLSLQSSSASGLVSNSFADCFGPVQ
eukprot:15283230-Ditylum_brightwellii.AAC.1